MNSKLFISLLATVMVTTWNIQNSSADGAVYSCTNADGTVELSAQSNGTNCELLSGSESSTPTARSEATDPSQTGSSASSQNDTTGKDNKDAEKDPREKYRDAMINGSQGAEGAPATAANPSVNRRYLKIDKESFRKAIGADGVAQ